MIAIIFGPQSQIQSQQNKTSWIAEGLEPNLKISGKPQTVLGHNFLLKDISGYIRDLSEISDKLKSHMDWI